MGIVRDGLVRDTQTRMSVAAARGAWRALRRRLRVGPLYRWRFSGRVPDRVLIAPPDLRAADPLIAQDIYHGRFPFAGHMVDARGRSPFSLALANREWNAALHSFRWLRHSRAAGTDLAAANARALTSDWIAGPGRRIGGLPWEGEIVAARLVSWLSHSPVVLQGADLVFYRTFLRSMMVQVRYLRAVAPEMPLGIGRLHARIALAFAALALPVSANALRSASHNLSEELDRQILPDGGHASRNPEALIDLLTDLLPLRHTFSAQGEQPPASLISAVERMLPALRFFRHSDGSIARFNGAGATAHERVAAILRHDDTNGAPLLNASHSGYQRMSLGGTVVIADTGPAPPIDLAGEANAGCLSFELSSGRQSLIVNSGIDRLGAGDFRPLARATAAHSAVVLNDTSSARFNLHGHARAGGLADTPLVDGPRHVPCERHDDDSSQGFTASHDGYLSRFGFTVERTLRLDADGSRLSGQDRLLARSDARGPDGATVRFHLHPDVELFLDENGDFVLRSQREAWTFESFDVPPRVEESIFFAGIAGPRRSRQIVLAFKAFEQPELRWRFVRREDIA